MREKEREEEDTGAWKGNLDLTDGRTATVNTEFCCYTVCLFNLFSWPSFVVVNVGTVRIK